jgi:hypothetical protein
MHHYRQQVTQGIYRYVSLAAFDLLARIEPALPPFSADARNDPREAEGQGAFVG